MGCFSDSRPLHGVTHGSRHGLRVVHRLTHLLNDHRVCFVSGVSDRQNIEAQSRDCGSCIQRYMARAAMMMEMMMLMLTMTMGKRQETRLPDAQGGLLD